MIAITLKNNQMKKILLTICCLSICLFACKKDSETTNPEEEPKTEEPTNVPTEGNIQISDNTNNTAKYDDKTITVKSFTIDKILPTITTGYAQITIQSTDKDGLFTKYSIGVNMLSGLPATGVKTSILSGSTPLIGINIYQDSGLYPYSAMNGTFTVNANDGHNVTMTFSDIDMKQSFMQGFDASNKRFKVKSFKIKFSY